MQGFATLHPSSWSWGRYLSLLYALMGSHIHMMPGPPKSRSGCYPCVPTTITTIPYNLIIIPKACNLCMLVHKIFEPEITQCIIQRGECSWNQVKEERGGRRKRKLEDGSYTQFLSKQTGLMTPQEQPITLLVSQECQEDITTHTYASQIESAFLQDPRNLYCI